MDRKAATDAVVDVAMEEVAVTTAEKAKSKSRMLATLAAMASADDRLRPATMMEASTRVARVSASDVAALVDLVLTMEVDRVELLTTRMVSSEAEVVAVALVEEEAEEMAVTTLIKAITCASEISDFGKRSCFLPLKIC